MACSNTTGSKTAVGLEFKSPWAHFKFSVPGFPFPDDGGSEFFLSNFSEFKNLRFWAPTKLLSGFLVMFFHLISGYLFLMFLYFWGACFRSHAPLGTPLARDASAIGRKSRARSRFPVIGFQFLRLGAFSASFLSNFKFLFNHFHHLPRLSA